MSRSRLHTPAGGWTGAPSEKEFKQQAHKKERRRTKMHLDVGDDDTDLPHSKKYGNPWSGPKDGRQYFGHLKETSKQDYEELMRK